MGRVPASIQRWQRGSIWTTACPSFMQIEKLGFPLSTLFQGKRVGLFCGSSRWRLLLGDGARKEAAGVEQ
jgi:hypothetical protein